jgi:hypothetical protein
MNYGLSDQVRSRAKSAYVAPAISKGTRQFSISVKELLRDLQAEGFPANHARQVCTAITSRKFLRENSLEIEGVDGPPSKNSTTVVVHYKVPTNRRNVGATADESSAVPSAPSEETPEEWAHRMTSKIRGLLKEELAEYGGGEAFLRWVRGYDEEGA